MAKKALMVYGGWDGHEPQKTSERFKGFLEASGFTVVVKDTLDAYTDAVLMGSVNLIVQCWTMGTITNEQYTGLQTAIASGVGFAGWHGGMCDAFRANLDYQWLTGGQFVGHPGNLIDYPVHITSWSDPITEGISDFTMTNSEQYYMLVDPANLVLADSTFSGAHREYTAGVVMPTIWKKRWGKGKIFFSAIGHVAKDFDLPQPRTITERGLLWAAR